MAKNYGKLAQRGRSVDILSSKATAQPIFTDEEKKTIAGEHGRLVDDLWKQDIDALARELKPQLDLLQAAVSDKSLIRAIEARGLGTNLGVGGQTIALEAHMAHSSALSLCDGHLTSPPYTSGDPMTEEFGADVIPLSGPGDLKTFSELALPAEGALSVGVSNGNFFESTIHPSAEDFVLGDANSARASIGYYLACVPGAPLQRATRMNVTIDVAVGEPSRSFFLLMVGDPLSPGMGIVGVRGVIYLTLSGSESSGPQTHTRRFLNSAQNFVGPIDGSMEPLRNFTVSESLHLGPGATWIYVNVEVRLRAFRFVFGPVEERKGFSMIDLRSPDHDTHRVNFILEPGGPVRIPKISMTFCPVEVLAPGSVMA